MWACNSSISWTERTGKKRKKTMSMSGMAAAEASVIDTSTHVGE